MNKKENMEINYEFLHMFDDFDIIDKKESSIKSDKKEKKVKSNKKENIKKNIILSIDKNELEGLKNILDKIDKFKENNK